jgi:hypothetical protein
MRQKISWTDGQTDRGKTVYPPPPSGSGGIISNLYRGPSIDASYQVSVQLAKQFQGRRFLEIDQFETRIACGSHVC